MIGAGRYRGPTLSEPGLPALTASFHSKNCPSPSMPLWVPTDDATRSVGALISEAVDQKRTGTVERKAALLACLTVVGATDGLEGVHP